MQAAVGVAQLDKLPGFIEARRRELRALHDGLRDLEELLDPARGQRRTAIRAGSASRSPSGPRRRSPATRSSAHLEAAPRRHPAAVRRQPAAPARLPRHRAPRRRRPAKLRLRDGQRVLDRGLPGTKRASTSTTCSTCSTGSPGRVPPARSGTRELAMRGPARRQRHARPRQRDVDASPPTERRKEKPRWPKKLPTIVTTSTSD